MTRRAGRVVGEVHVAAIDEGAVPPVTVSVNSAIGWMGRVLEERITIPLRRVEAFSRVRTPYCPSSVVIRSLMWRASRRPSR
jgi:hypothetical protein